ncbi:helix-turn-helix transcriptional regulator [Paenibacillus eucommiae]|uniref:DNA-binding transcriptional regulator YafY n=1 Tax=Paenibacillus eucommiae TaxID=1355755 RepID=A0ABS4ISV5_9BACL|nr:WYL domain-containing protein [Paenibacillus eucommiae]MBP1990651.1 putative DNA-binding transcriptional regulator YafY [Paenibacillus eucommiae]
MRADRLLSILLLLQNHGRLSSRQLAEKLEVSERTIHRDMEALSASGIPVYAERGSNGGWALTEGYRTDLTGMKAGEIQALLLIRSSSLLSDLGMGADFEAAFQKLLAASPATVQKDAEYVRQRLHVDGAGWHQSNESLPHLAAVQEAVWEQRKLSIHYKRDGAVVQRIVHPLGLVAKRSVWYLVAAVYGKIREIGEIAESGEIAKIEGIVGVVEIEGIEEMRTYRISRLLDAQMLEETFTPPADFDLAQYWGQSTEQFKSKLPRYPAHLRLSEKLLPRIAQERYIRVLHTYPAENGLIEAEVEFHTLESACEMLLGFGPLAEALAPAELRDRVISEARAIMALYRKEN